VINLGVAENSLMQDVMVKVSRGYVFPHLFAADRIGHQSSLSEQPRYPTNYLDYFPPSRKPM
jgi:hypothetical protein